MHFASFLLSYYLLIVVSVSFALKNEAGATSSNVLIISSVILPILLLVQAYQISKMDFAVAKLEYQLVYTSPGVIYLAKVLAFFINALPAFIAQIVFLLLQLQQAKYGALFLFVPCQFLILFHASLIAATAAALQAYFKSDFALLNVLLIALLLPDILLMSTVNEANIVSIIGLLLGIVLIMAPILLASAVFLFKNIYNISN